MKEREMNEKLVFERSRKGRRGFRFPETGVPAVWGKSGRPSGPGATTAPETTGGRTGPAAIQPIGADRVTANLRREVPEGLIRSVPADLPELSEVDVIRHYTGLSRRNYGVDIGFYPLGSCTMKYNPKVNEEIAKLPGFAEIHPLQPEDTVQGMLVLLHETLTMLSEVTGMSWGTLQPLAGAHGEFTGMKLFRAYFRSRGEDDRRVIIVPDSSHGTNPASAHIAGFDVVEIPSDGRGMVSPEVLRPYLNGNLAGIMMTNPNTLGIFERDIKEISALIHEAGGLLYYDGANMNAILGKARPGDMGFDVVHLNLHKTFSTPHGGGGPGSGAVLVNEKLRPFLPGPDIRKEGARYRWAGEDRYRRAGGGEANGGGQASDGIPGGTGTSPGNNETSLSIGRMAAFHGNIGVVVRAWAYLKAMGGNGLERASELAVLNANYLKEKLKKIVTLPYDTLCKHEFVLSAKELKESYGASALDIAKGLLDYGVHPPTIYFPLIVPEALMIEPTETESVETLDSFVETMRGIVETARQNPGVLKEAPTRTVVRRIDEVTAAKRPIVRWKQGEER